MPKFAYKAIDSLGVEQYGVVEAENEKDAINEVGRKGLFPTEVRHANITDDLRLKWKEQRQHWEEVEARKLERQKKRHTRQRLVVRYKDGRTEYGVCFALNPRDTGFHLDKVDANGATTGEAVQVRYSDLKAVFYVKSFDGKFDKGLRFREWTPDGKELVVEFKDGEVIRGFSLQQYDPEDQRFYLIPKDPATNNISVLIEKSALAHVFTPEEYDAHRREKLEARKAAEGGTELSQEETMGDFYFETRNYPQALEQYMLAAKKFPHSGRIRKKMLAAQYNIGVNHIKRREYAEALACMQKVLHVDPRNAHAQKKVQKLQKILEHPDKAVPTKTLEQDF